MATSTRHDNLRKRTFQFAVASINAARPLVQDPIGRHLVGQVVRSAGSVAANYDGACHARSRKDFASKVGIVAEESSETGVWFKIFVALELLRADEVSGLIGEAGEIAAIATASARTASLPR
jgi:four helix bundle protein